MSEKQGEKQVEQKPTESQVPKEKEREIKITVDSEQTKILAEQLAKAEAAKKEMEDKLAKIEADNKAQAEIAKKSAEETEDLKNKLGIIAEKELEKKRTSVKEKANALLKDSERVKEIESKLSTPEGIAAMEYTMNVLEKQMKAGEEQFKAYQEAERKKAEEAAKVVADTKAKTDAEAVEVAKKGKPQPKPSEPAGSPLVPQQMGGSAQPTDLMHIKFDSYAAMVRYLREVEIGPDRERAAEAKAALNELLKKWAGLVKQHHDSMTSTPPEELTNAPSIKDMMKSKESKGLTKAALEELRRRQQNTT